FAIAGPIARKIRGSGRIAREFRRPIFWPRGRFLSRQQRLQHTLRTAMLAGVIACGAPRQSPEQSQISGLDPQGGDLTVTVRPEPQSYCSCVVPQATAHLITVLTEAKLARVNPSTDDIDPWLAESWTRSDDGLRYVIKLRPNVHFSDGARLTADDVVFSLAAAYAPESAVADSLHVLGK